MSEEIKDWVDITGFAKYNGIVYPYKKVVGDYLFLQDIVGKGFNTIVVNIKDCTIIKKPLLGEVNR